VALARNTDGQDRLTVASTDESPRGPRGTSGTGATTAIEDSWITTRIEAKYFLEPEVKGRSIEVLVVNWPDGLYQTERFRSQSDFRRRLVELQERIDEEGTLWSDSPAARDDWRNRTRR
jgi:hypothetical protein